MILTKYLCKLHPFISAIVPQTRNLRSNIKIGKDKFQLSVDVHKFNKDELRVKVRPDCLVIEGKQERKTKTGYVMRRFTRKFRSSNYYFTIHCCSRFSFKSRYPNIELPLTELKLHRHDDLLYAAIVPLFNTYFTA